MIHVNIKRLKARYRTTVCAHYAMPPSKDKDHIRVKNMQLGAVVASGS